MKRLIALLLGLMVLGTFAMASPAQAGRIDGRIDAVSVAAPAVAPAATSSTTYWHYSTCRWSNGSQDSVGVKYESIGGGVVHPIQVSHNGQPRIDYARWDWIFGGVIRQEANFVDGVPNQVHNWGGTTYGSGGRVNVRLTGFLNGKSIGNCYGYINP